MIRTLSAEAFQKIAEHEMVAPWVGYLRPDIIQNPANICLLTDAGDGGYVLVNHQPGLYEAHTLALSSARGKPMHNLMREGFRFLFIETDCVEVTTMVPDGNRAASRWTQLAGFREVFRRNDAFTYPSGECVGAIYYSLRYEDWVLMDDANLKLGREFHTYLESIRTHSHPDDDTHDAFVGAAFAGCMAGNPFKAIGLFNRWAAQAGYMKAQVLSATPLLVDIGDAVIELRDGKLNALSIRQAPLHLSSGPVI